MPLRVSGIRLPVDAGEPEVVAVARRLAGIDRSDLASFEIVRRSLDRRHRRLVFEWTLDLRLIDEARLGAPRRWPSGVQPVQAEVAPELRPGEQALEHPPVVVGSGPAGYFAAVLLARHGYRPIVIERGEPMNLRAGRIRALNVERKLDPESNYLYGEGGAGTFSDGKLTSRSKDPRAELVLREFRDKSGIASITYDYRPHLGSDRVRTVVGRLRKEILALGGTIRFGVRAEGLRLVDRRLVAVRTSAGELGAEVAILATGHSARDFYRALRADGIAMEPKPFQLGLRVEHPQAFVDHAVFGEHAGHPALGAADYRLAVEVQGASVFSFCMCPGGEIIPAVSDLAHMNTNGMSWSGKATGYANSGIVTTLDPELFGGEGALAGLELQERFEARAADLVGHGVQVPAARLCDFLAGRPSSSLPGTSCRTGLVPANLELVLPEVVRDRIRGALGRMERQMRGFLSADALVVGPESRSSSPVRLLRDAESLVSSGTDGVYPVGEGAGYAGGIVSAAADGLRAAEAVIARYAPVRPPPAAARPVP